MNCIEECEKIIDSAWEIFKEIPLGRENLELLSSYKVRLHQPCMLAVAGKVKAGKSSFLNALIGEELAKVGDLETTATINKFVYGTPADARYPVKVVWDDGTETFETLDFMDSLQGYDKETLSKASKISYLEYLIENPLLRELTLVDTPGTGAVIDEHQEVAEKFFNLREKHKKQTNQCTSEADAVVYLMGAVANVHDQGFLKDFKESTESGMPLNAIGVLSKVDIDVALLERRNEQAQYLGECLKNQLNTVIPVSAGLYTVIKTKRNVFDKWQKTFKSIPADTFNIMMKAEQLYLLPTYSDIPIPIRKEMKQGIPWSIFRTIAKQLYVSDDLDSALKELEDIANIKEVERIIKDYFFNRSKTIRCARVLSDLQELCQRIQIEGIFKLHLNNDKFKRWEKFVEVHSKNSDSKELLEYLRTQHKEKEEIDALEQRIAKELKMKIEEMQIALQDSDIDFQMLKLLQSSHEGFTESEYTELAYLFGQFGKPEIAPGFEKYKRLNYWGGEELFVRSKIKRNIIHHAIIKYSKL